MPGAVDPSRAGLGASVLIVHPDDPLRAICLRLAEEAGVTVRVATGGEEALDLISQAMPQVIVIDAGSSEGEGLDWLRSVKSKPATCGIPIISVVALNADGRPRPGEWAFDGFLTKPVQAWELVHRVRSMTRLRQHRLELAESRSLRGEQTRVWGLLLEFSRSVVRAKGLESLLDRIVHTAAEMTSSRRVSLMLPDRKQQYLMIAKSIGLDEKLAADVKVPIGEAIAGRVYRSGRPITALDDHEELVQRRGFDFHSFVSMPMTYTTMSLVHQRVGVINIGDRYGDRPFEEWELEVIDMFGSIAGSAIDTIHSRETHESLLRIERDLQVARRIQRSTFPQRLPAMHGFEIDAWSEPAEETAGDTYDVIGFRHQEAGPPVISCDIADSAILLLADATGHGIGPALSVTQVRAMLRMAALMRSDLLAIARNMNEQLCADLPGGRFVTVWLGELNAAEGTLTSFSGGQAPIVHYRADRGEFDVRPADTMPLGIDPSLEFTINDPIEMQPGDVVAVVSDGLLEAMDGAGDQFGTERALEVIAAHIRQRPIRIRTALRRAVEQFTSGAPATDDRTMIIVKRLEQ